MQTLFQCDVSVIVPVYNLEKFITPLLNSLKEQELGDYHVEYIFVLNNCTDESERVIRESGLDARIYTCEQQGCGLARNVGFENSHGMYIWYMDGDDWLLEKTAIKDALDKAKRENLNILRIPFDSNAFTINYFSMVWQYLFKRSFIEEFQFTEIQPCEDDEYMVKVLNKAGYSPMTYLQMPHLNNIYYYYNYLREGSNMYRVKILGEDINGSK